MLRELANWAELERPRITAAFVQIQRFCFPVCQSVCMSVSLSVCLSVCLCLSVIRLSVFLFVCLDGWIVDQRSSVYLSVFSRLSAYPFVCLSFSLSLASLSLLPLRLSYLSLTSPSPLPLSLPLPSGITDTAKPDRQNIKPIK